MNPSDPNMAGQQGGYPPQGQGGYPPQGQGGYPPQGQGGYPPQGQGGYPPQGQGGYPPQSQGGYPPQGQGGYQQVPQGQGGYPPQGQGGYPPQGQGGYPPQGQGGYQQVPQGPPANQVQGQGGYPPQGQGGYQGQAPGEKQQIPGYPRPFSVDDSDDGEDNEDEIPAQAPPPMEAPRGYGEDARGQGGFFAPPPMDSSLIPSAPPEETRQFVDVSALSVEDARECLLEYISQFCCYGSRAAKNMVVREIKPTNAIHYSLETFTEGRQVDWASKPYTGGVVDGPECGPPPQPWDVPVQVAEDFKDTVYKIEVPHTATVKPCHHCFCQGYIMCINCHGRGRRRCTWCHGSGHRHTADGDDRCNWCHGSGHRNCIRCHGSGLVQCTTCKGAGNCKCYLELTITWKNNQDHYIDEKTDLPDELITKVTGACAFTETNIRVWPISHFPSPGVNQASHQLVTKHNSAFQFQRMLNQRHSVQIVPVNEVQARYNDDMFRFFIYGNEKKIYAPEYPQQQCCGCSII